MTRQRALELIVGEAHSLMRGNAYAIDDRDCVPVIGGALDSEVHDGRRYVLARQLANRFDISEEDILDALRAR